MEIHMELHIKILYVFPTYKMHMYYHMLYLRIYGLPYVIYDVFGLPYGLPLGMISIRWGGISYGFPYALHGITYGIAYDFCGSVLVPYKGAG